MRTLFLLVAFMLTPPVARSQTLHYRFLPGLEYLAENPQLTRPVSRPARQTRTVSAAAEKPQQLLFFHASWCGPCKLMAPSMRGFQNVVDVDVDRQSQLKVKYGVSSIPVVVVLRGGLEVGRMVGYASKETLQNWLRGLGTEAQRPRVQQYEIAQPANSPISLDRQYSGVWLGSG